MRKLCFLLLIIPFFLMGQDDDSSNIINVTHITVKMGHSNHSNTIKRYKESAKEIISLIDKRMDND